MEKEAFASKIREYVQHNISCAEIPKEVALGYPIELLQSKHFKIVDTPGINAIDSLTELYLRESFYQIKTMDEIQTILSDDPKVMGLTAPCYFKANGDRNEFLDLLEAQANFDEICKRIERDAQNSASIQMKDFANAIREDYEVLDNNMSVRIEPLRKKHQNPQTFALEIQKHKDETERMRRDYNVFTYELREEFNPQDRNNRYYQQIKQIVDGFRRKVNRKNFNPDKQQKKKDVESYVEKLREDYYDEMTKFVKTLEANFKKRIEERAIDVQSN